MARHASSHPSGHVRMVGIAKAVYGLILGAAALGAFHLVNKDLGDAIEHAIVKLHLDPENHFVRSLMGLAGLDHGKREALAAGTLFFSLLELIEGIGLVYRQMWAHYLTVISTCILMAPECYEIAKHVSVVRIAILLINLCIAGYLVVRLKQQKGTKN